MSPRHYGEGARAALAIHCSLAHAGEWAGIGTALADLLTITAVDLPGHGTAPDWVLGTDIAEVAEALVLTELPEVADLIGHSFGAVVALRLALNHPDRVRGLVLIEPTLFAAAAGTPAADAHIARHADFDAACAAGGSVEAARLFTAIWGTGEGWSALPERQRNYIAKRIHLIPASHSVLNEDTGHLLAPGRLEALDVPVLLIEGSASPPVIGAIATKLTRRLPKARRATVAGAGHMLPVTHAPQVAAAIRAFLSPE